MITVKRYLCRLLVIIGFSFTCGSGAISAATTSDEVAFERLKKQIREADRNNPAEAEQVIQRLEADRQAAKHLREHPEEMELLLTSFVSRMKEANSPTKSAEFSAAREALQAKLEWFAQNKVLLAPNVGNKLAHTILEIYEQRESFSPIPDSFPATVTAKYANSPRAKAFLLQILDGPSEELRRHTLTELAWSNSLKGDKDIFEGLARRRKVDDKNSSAILGAMSRLDRARALPILLQEIDTTKDIRRFTQDSDILSEYGRVELLDHPLSRIKDFPRGAWATTKNPTIGIYPELLLRYIGSANGEKLESALYALEQSVEALEKSGPTIRAKLQNPEPLNRRATAQFVLRMRDVPIYRDSKTLEVISAVSSRESDGPSRQALQEFLSHARSRKGR